MSSWVRYCIAVYVGLLLSGALARPPWTRPYQPPAPEAMSRDTVVPMAPAPTLPQPAATDPADRSA